MATPLNVELAAGMQFSIPEDTAPHDLLVAVRAADQATIDAALAALTAALARADSAAFTSTGTGAGPAPRTVRSAALADPDSAVVLLSVPGSAVLGEAMDAVAAGRHVMIFSDNVPIEHEIALKTAATEAGVLVMGPDCGTTIVGGVGLGFANSLRDSGFAVDAKVGVVAASGTGAQQLCCLLDEAGVAVSHVLGVGGRDLSEAVGARSALTALAMLDADPGTDEIVIISKPTGATVAELVQTAATEAGTPVTLMLLGGESSDITASVEELLRDLSVPVPEWPMWGAADPPSHGARGSTLRGLFAGGTLADEAMVLASKTLGDIVSNIPLRPELALPATAVRGGLPHLEGSGHTVLDLGDDRFTVGRGHPMIDPTLRLDLLAAQAADPSTGVVLLDVVLGFGAEPDPAARLAPAIAAAISTAAADGRALPVVVSLCGTASDPQDRQRQAESLVAAGATVFLSNAAATRHAVRLLQIGRSS
jgi:FdrA protein